MNNKTIGLISLCSSPFLAIDFMVHGGFDNHIPTSLGGLFNLIYMTGWFLCILTLYQMHARTKKIVRIVFATQVVFLCLAEISNLWSIVQPVSNNNLFTILDLFWPVS